MSDFSQSSYYKILLYCVEIEFHYFCNKVLSHLKYLIFSLSTTKFTIWSIQFEPKMFEFMDNSVVFWITSKNLTTSFCDKKYWVLLPLFSWSIRNKRSIGFDLSNEISDANVRLPRQLPKDIRVWYLQFLISIFSKT